MILSFQVLAFLAALALLIASNASADVLGPTGQGATAYPRGGLRDGKRAFTG